MPPILTITVPCYNVARYLERSLPPYCAEVLRGDIEVILVDDGSTDTTPVILKRFADARPDLFKIVTKENGGHGSAVNAGLKTARGTYFRVVDGDDWVNPDGLARTVEAMKNTDTDLVIDLKREVHFENGESELFPLPKETPERGIPIAFETICNKGDIESYIMIHTLSAKTKYLRSIGLKLLEKTFYEDYEYIVKSTVPAHSIMFLDNEVYQYLVGNVQQSVSAVNYVNRWGDHVRVLNELLRYSDEQKANGSLSLPVAKYLDHKITLMVHTLYNIALIYDLDRKRGLNRGKALRADLANRAPEIETAARRRWLQARILHALGFDSRKLDALMGRRLTRA